MFQHSKDAARITSYLLDPLQENWRHSQEEIRTEFINYYKDLFTSPSYISLPDDLPFPSPLSKADQELHRIPSSEEIWVVIKEMHPSKTPDLDGLPTLFYQKNWDVIASDVTSTIQQIFSFATFPDKTIHTLTLILKKNCCILHIFVPLACVMCYIKLWQRFLQTN